MAMTADVELVAGACSERAASWNPRVRAQPTTTGADRVATPVSSRFGIFQKLIVLASRPFRLHASALPYIGLRFPAAAWNRIQPYVGATDGGSRRAATTPRSRSGRELDQLRRG